MKTFHKPIPILSLFALLLVAVWACRKEKPAFDLSDKDPCSCAQEVSADFVIEELATHIPTEIWVQTDTSNNYSIMKFTAKEDNATYKWYIGSQVFTARSASRVFNEQWIGHDIPITLVVQKQPNSICFPDDDGYDSITKYFHVSEYPIVDLSNYELYHPIEGTYRVWGPTVQDSIEVTFNARLKFQTTSQRAFDMINPDGSGIECVGDADRNAPINYFAFRRVSFGAPSNASGTTLCNSLGGTLTRDANNRVTIDLWANLGWPTEFIENSWSFKGRKIS